MGLRLYREFGDAGFGLVTKPGGLRSSPSLIEVDPQLAVMALLGRAAPVRYQASNARIYWRGPSTAARFHLLVQEWRSILWRLGKDARAIELPLPRSPGRWSVRACSASKARSTPLPAPGRRRHFSPGRFGASAMRPRQSGFRRPGFERDVPDAGEPHTPPFPARCLSARGSSAPRCVSRRRSRGGAVLTCIKAGAHEAHRALLAAARCSAASARFSSAASP